MTTKETSAKSARSRVREWVKDRLVTSDDFAMPAIVDDCIAVLGQDQKFIQTLLRENVRPLIYEIVQQEVTQSRHLVLMGDEVIAKGELVQRATRISAFATWFEHCGTRHVRLLDATKEELLLAAAERENRGMHELTLAHLWRNLAEKLKHGQAVRDVWTAEEIEAEQVALGKKLQQQAG